MEPQLRLIAMAEGSMETLKLENGKYELRYDSKEHTLKAYRHGEMWQDFTGNKFIYLLFIKAMESDYYTSNFFQQPYQLSEKDIKLREFAERYSKETEAYDRMVCTGPIIEGSIRPMNARETALISRNASRAFNEIAHMAIQYGITGKELRSEILSIP